MKSPFGYPRTIAIPSPHPRLRALLSAFLEENAKLNLSALRTEDACWTGNILDSIAALDLPILHSAESKTILDLGTGGGFPLLPIAISRPNMQCTGLDSVQKKVKAVNAMIQKLELKNVVCLCGRAEEFGRSPDHREKFDIVTARAIAEVNVLLEYASPFVKPGGHIILWKSLSIEKELANAEAAEKELSCRLADRHTYTLPGDFGTRQLLVFEKMAKISDKYPRGVGVPRKQPLLEV